jgi:hypothetical protein
VGAAAGLIEVEDAVDDGAGVAVRIAHHMADGEGRFVEERRHLRRAGASGADLVDDRRGAGERVVRAAGGHLDYLLQY